MNYLAHTYLSGDDYNIAIGNFIADSVKGREYKNYPALWQKGILLHRFIDSYTDSHLIFKNHSKIFFDSHRHYSRVLIDLFYDHLLAKNWDKYNSISLSQFSKEFYNKLLLNKEHLPSKIKYLLKYMIRDDWFTSYSTLEGLKKILTLMEARTAYPSMLSNSLDKFVKHSTRIESQFFIFFEDIQKAVKNKLLNIPSEI
tara:strand:- start:1876 stop:2472 length:597 start_codon:yes stop_codon:yes gene_type:complete